MRLVNLDGYTGLGWTVFWMSRADREHDGISHPVTLLGEMDNIRASGLNIVEGKFYSVHQGIPRYLSLPGPEDTQVWMKPAVINQYDTVKHTHSTPLPLIAG